MIATIVGVIALVITIAANVVAITRFSTKQEVALSCVQSTFKDFKDDINNHIKELKMDINEKINANQENTEKQLQRLEYKQEKHNNLIERVYANERDISVIKEQIKVENHRIADLEENQSGNIANRN